MPAMPVAPAAPSFSMHDMQLLHNWTTRANIFNDFSKGPHKRLWSEAVVDIAFEHQFFMHGILALSAMHKTLDDADANRASLLAQADAHMSVSLAEYRSLLEHPTEETLIPMFLLSSIVYVYNLAWARIEEPEQPIDAVLHCFRLMRGVRVLMCAEWMRPNVRGSFVIGQLLGPIRATDGPLPPDKECTPIMALEGLAAQLESPTKEICSTAIFSLHAIAIKMLLCPPNRKHSITIIW
jgi:hypothetical protein